MTKAEDLPLKFDPTVSFTLTAKREFWNQRAALAVVNNQTAVELAYLTIGYGTYLIDVDSVVVEYIDTVETPEDMFGIKYTWAVTPVAQP